MFIFCYILPCNFQECFNIVCFNYNHVQINLSIMWNKLIFLIFVIINLSYSQQILEDEQQSYLQQFAQIMANFIPTQSYTFDLEPGEQLTLSFWEDDNIDHLRGVFYVSDGINKDDGDDFGLTISCVRNNQVEQNFQNKKLGVLKLNYTSGEMSLVFKSIKIKLTIYLSYELTLKTKVQKLQRQKKANENPEIKQQTEQNKQQLTKMSQISNRFLKTQSEIRKIQNVVKTVMHYEQQYKIDIENNIKWSHFRIILQTMLVIGSSSFCLYVLKKKLKKDYQLLV